MLTPKFSLSQDSCSLFIKIYAPHIQKDEAEIHIEGDEVYFYCKPYYLRLHLPGRILEDDRSKSSYDIDSGWLSLTLSKESDGEHFENLDMLTKLLTPKPRSLQTVSPSVEVLSSKENDIPDNNTNEKKDNCSDDEMEFEPDWFIDQIPSDELKPDSFLSAQFSYGFARQKTNPLKDLVSEYPEMIDLIEPDSVPLKQRGILRFEQEQDKFDCEHYLADFFDNDMLQDIIAMDFQVLTGTKGEKLSEKEQEHLLLLPRKEYIIDEEDLTSVYIGLYDLVFAYAFNFRQSLGEDSIESDWTICKLSSYLSWLDSFTDLKSLVITSGRRCLSFPLYRNWALFEKVLSDVKLIFEAGKLQILKCLLNIRMILNKSEAHSPLSAIYLTDYCVWIQSACPKKLLSLSKALNEIKVSKDLIGFKLKEMEADAEQLMELSDTEDIVSASEIDKLASAVSNVVKICEGDDSDDESDSEETETETDSSESESDEA